MIRSSVFGVLGLLTCGALCWADPPTKSSETPKASPTQVVIAEGVGTTADEALKDAFRNAVRQVVGVVVDAETLVKNDELISDQVLTFSNGFVKKYDEVGKKESKGLIRLTIKAEVERKGVIEKLKAANVKVKDVDGKGLFAEALTNLEREKNAAALLKKTLEGFPRNCMTVNVVGDPKLLEKTGDKATVSVQVEVSVDREVYKAFVKKLQPVLEELAPGKESKGEFLVKTTAQPEGYLQGERFMAYKQPEWMPKAFKSDSVAEFLHKDKFAVALCSHATQSADQLDFQYYLLDNSLLEVVGPSAVQGGSVLKLTFLDASEEQIATDRFSVGPGKPGNGGSDFSGTPSVMTHGNGFRAFESVKDVQRQRTSFSTDRGCVFFISPTFFNYDNYIRHKPKLQIERKLTLSLDELKKVQKVKVELQSADK